MYLNWRLQIQSISKGSRSLEDGTPSTVVAVCICLKCVTNVSKHCSMCKSDGAMPFSLSCQKVICTILILQKHRFRSPLSKTYGANNLCWAKVVGCGVHPTFWVECYKFGRTTTKWHLKTCLVEFCRKRTSVEKFDFELKLKGKIASA